ncbi:hypothetical protein [Treponema sp. R80B11-R83G3]
MNKKAICIALVLLVFFAVGSIFADEILQCKDPKDGKVTISKMGDQVLATYSGKSAQNFDVLVELKDGTVQKLSFSFPKTTSEQTRTQYKQARCPIEKVTKCNFQEY